MALEEGVLRSGRHPVQGVVDSRLLQSAVENDPELELLLRTDELQKIKDEQQDALVEARVNFRKLEERYELLESDFHAAIHQERDYDPAAPRIELSADCLLAVRAARERACPCNLKICSPVQSGAYCEEPAELPACLATWGLPYEDKTYPWFLTQTDIDRKYGPDSGEEMTLQLGDYPTGGGRVNKLELTLNGQIKAMLPENSPVRADGENYRTCAIVGSSDNLLRQWLGQEIDDHELIVRFNGATTKGFEQHVGRVTNLRFVTSDWLGFREFPLEKVVLLDPKSGRPLTGCDRDYECKTPQSTIMKYVKALKLFQELRVTQLHPDVIQWLHKEFVEKTDIHTLSPGFQATMLMMHHCEKIDLYGFAGHQVKKYYDSLAVQEKFAMSVMKWEHEFQNEDPVSYPFKELPFRRLHQVQFHGVEEAAGAAAGEAEGEAAGAAAGAAEGAVARKLLKVKGKKAKPAKKGPPAPAPAPSGTSEYQYGYDASKTSVVRSGAAPEPAPLVEDFYSAFKGDVYREEVHGRLKNRGFNLLFERKCQQQMVDKGRSRRADSARARAESPRAGAGADPRRSRAPQASSRCTACTPSSRTRRTSSRRTRRPTSSDDRGCTARAIHMLPPPPPPPPP